MPAHPERRPAQRDGGERLGHADVFAALCALSFAGARFLPVLRLGFICPFKALTGLPCATCGMTHAFVALAHGDALAALAHSPLGALLAAGGWLFALADAARLVAGWRWPALPARLPRVAALATAAALVVNWAYLLATGAA